VSIPQARWQVPAWSLPPGIEALQTERGQPDGWGFNLAQHVGAPADEVAAHRARLLAQLPPGARIGWLRQVHGTRVVELPQGDGAEADAVIAREPGWYCAVLTADCLPVLFADAEGTAVAAAHAGWRGLAAGVLEATVAAMAVPPARLRVWLGPRIGPEAFEVGPEVLEAFQGRLPQAAAAFRPLAGSDRLMADLGSLAQQVLEGLGVTAICDSGLCTVKDPRRWYSYRRDGVCGRMASLIGRRP
jgi:polyphenol oxidase